MKKLRWQLIIIFLTGLVVGILLLGEQPSSGVQSLTPEPARGGVYSEALIGSPQRLNPVLDANNQVDRDVDRLIFSGLMRFDARGVPQKDLVESMGISKDGTVYNFTLKPNIKWHDGEPLTSDDIIYTIDLIRTGGEAVPSDMRAFWEDVDVNSLSDNTLQFRLPEPFAPFLDYLTFGVLPQHILGSKKLADIINDPFNLQPVGSGPYRFDQLIVENNKITGIQLKANESYYDKAPFLDQVIFHYYPDSASALQAYRDGKVNGIGKVTADILPSVLATPNLSLYTGRMPQLTMVLLNLKDPSVAFLQDVNVRKALLMGMNRQSIINKIMKSQAILADGPILPDTWAYYDGVQPVSFDQQAAQTTLKEAGFVVAGDNTTVRAKGDVKLSFTLLYPDTPQHKAIAESIQSDWQALQIDVKLEAVPYNELVNNRLDNRSFQAALVDLNLMRSADPDPYPFWDQAQATGGQNYSQWDNRVASEYLEQARITTDIDERARLYRNFQIVFGQELPALPLFYPVYSYAVDSKVQGVQMGPLYDTSDRFTTVKNWFLLAKASKPNPIATQSANK